MDEKPIQQSHKKRLGVSNMDHYKETPSDEEDYNVPQGVVAHMITPENASEASSVSDKEEEVQDKVSEFTPRTEEVKETLLPELTTTPQPVAISLCDNTDENPLDEEKNNFDEESPDSSCNSEAPLLEKGTTEHMVGPPEEESPYPTHGMNIADDGENKPSFTASAEIDELQLGDNNTTQTAFAPTIDWEEYTKDSVYSSQIDDWPYDNNVEDQDRASKKSFPTLAPSITASSDFLSTETPTQDNHHDAVDVQFRHQRLENIRKTEKSIILSQGGASDAEQTDIAAREREPEQQPTSALLNAATDSSTADEDESREVTGAFAISGQSIQRRSRSSQEGDQVSLIPNERMSSRVLHVDTEQAQVAVVADAVIAEPVVDEVLQARMDALEARLDEMRQHPEGDSSMVQSAELVVSESPISTGQLQEQSLHGVEEGLLQQLEDKPNQTVTQKRPRLVIILLLVVVVAIGVAVGVTVGIDDDGGSQPLSVSPSPTPAPGDLFWEQVGPELTGSELGDLAGHNVALSRDAKTLAVSAPETGGLGYVVVYKLSNNETWIPVGQEIVGQAVQDQFGWSVALNGDGNVLAIGSPSSDKGGLRAGHASAFEFDTETSSWVQIGSDVVAEEVGDGFGRSVSLSDAGNILAVGADEFPKVGPGSVRMYNRNTDPPWQQIGQTLVGPHNHSLFGHAVSLSASGTIVGIGAHDYGGREEGMTSAYVYENSTSTWVPMGDPFNGTANGERFGHSVSLSDDGLVMAVGSRWGKGQQRGSVSVFDFNASNSAWSLRGQAIDGEAEGDLFGWVVSLSYDGNMVAGGARFNSDTEFRSGQASIFEYAPDVMDWVQVGSDLNGDHPNEEFGKSISLCGNSSSPVVAVGGPFHGNRSGRAIVYSLSEA